MKNGRCDSVGWRSARWFCCGWFIFTLGAWASEWPQYRGPTHDGVSTDRITKQWSGSVTNPVWRAYFTNGLASLAVAGGRVFTQVARPIGGSAREVCVALDAANGAELWSRIVDDAYYPGGGVGTDDGPRTTPAVDGDGVYVLSSYIKLLRLNATNGSVVWSNDLRATYGGDVIGWQNAASPLVDDGLIFVNANSGPRRVVALHTSDGTLAWRSQDEAMNEAMTHSSAVLGTIHGVRQLVFAVQGGLIALDPRSGAALWRFIYPFGYNSSLAVSPVVHQDMVFISGAQSYALGSVVARINFSNNTWNATQLWANPGVSSTLASHWMTPVAHDGFLYGQFGVTSAYDSVRAQLKCVDMRTGTVRWSTNEFGRGSTLLVDNHLLVLTERGQLVLARLNSDTYTEVARFQAIPNYSGSANKCWNAPAVCDGRVYVRSTAQGACFDLTISDLKLEPPQRMTDNRLRLSVRTVDGSPVDADRLTGLELRAATNLTLAPPQWTRLTNSPVLTNGAVRFDDIETGSQSREFFQVAEPQ